MEKLSVLAEFEERANREGLDSDAFKMFLLLLANYDVRRRCGVIRLDTIAAAFGEGFSSARFNRVCHRLSDFGYVTVISHDRNATVEKDSTIVYGIPRITQGEGS
jgi:hypothetical protein